MLKGRIRRGYALQAALLLDVAETLNGFEIKDLGFRVGFRMERPGF